MPESRYNPESNDLTRKTLLLEEVLTTTQDMLIMFLIYQPNPCLPLHWNTHFEVFSYLSVNFKATYKATLGEGLKPKVEWRYILIFNIQCQASSVNFYVS